MTNSACLLYPAVACTGSGSNPTIYESASSTAISSVTASGLFPFYLGSSSQYTNNYQVWAGSCEQEQPLQPPTSTVFTQPAINTGFGSVTPAKSASTTTPDVYVDEPAVDVAVKYNGGSAVLPSHVTIKFSGKNSSGSSTCADYWHNVTRVGTETVGSTQYATYPAPFASQAAQGSTNPMASASGDTGTIQVCADYNGASGIYHEWSPTMTNTNFGGPTMVWGQTSGQVMDVYKDNISGSSGSGACP
jgi:hypothetical protein